MRHSVFVLLMLLTSVSPLLAANQTPPANPITQAELEQKLQAVKNRSNLGEDVRNRVLSIYAECQDNLKEAQTQDNRSETLKQALNALPWQSRHLARQISDAENSIKNRKPDKFGLFPTDELEQRLIMEKSALNDLDADTTHFQNQVNDELNRPQLIREKISEIKNKLALAQQEQQNVAGRGSLDIVEKEALQIQKDIRVHLLNSTLKMLELENISAPLLSQNDKEHIRLLNLQRERLSMQIADLENFLLDRRQQEIDKEQNELLQEEKAAEGKPPLIQAATRENIQYNRSLQEVNKNMELFTNQKDELDERYKEVEKDMQNAQQKINLAGISPALGNLLREQRRNLPRHKQFEELNDRIQNEIARTSLEAFKLEDARKNLNDLGQALLTRMNRQLPADASDTDKLRLRTELRMLLNDQKDLVLRLTLAYTEYSQILGEADFSLQQLLTASDTFRLYLDKHLLWIPSAPIIDGNYPQDVGKSLLWFTDPDNWRQLTLSLQQGIGNYPPIAVAGLVVIALHWRMKAGLRRRLQHTVPQINLGNLHYYSFKDTLQSLAFELMLSLSGPLLMLWLSGMVLAGHSADAFCRSFALGLLSAAISLTILQFFFRLFRSKGLAETRFQWHTHSTQLLCAQFKWLRFVLVPCIFLTAMTGGDAFSENSYALGRTALIVMMLAIAFAFHRMAHPATGLGRRFYLLSPDWSRAFRYLWYLAAILLPLAIIGFAVAGYYQSALELQQKLVYTLRLIFMTVLLHELAQRWMMMTKRRLVLRNAEQKRRQAMLAVDNPGLEAKFSGAEAELDMAKLNQQSDKLLTTSVTLLLLAGCWMIWRDILPAFSVFDRFVLWHHMQLVDDKEVLQPVTAINLFFSLLYAGLAFILVSNFPALVDLLLVGRYELTAGSRYALIQLTRYLLLGIAFVAIANELGGSWSQVQWLVAALGVGLGFGLQEIFANMVSGIILLFERPIRVGDTVTVGDVTGRVSRIQMRATHIVDYDRKELVVPNKTFITDRLINWTLSDTLSRIVVSVGVAYGSDIDRVEKVLLEAIANTPMVLKEPAPTVMFCGFGDSALNFDIYIFVHELSERISVRHSVHRNIYDALRANGIEIPFPQRDVHVYQAGVGE